MWLKMALAWLLATQALAERESKGIFDEAEKIWAHINTGIDQFQVSAREDLAKLRPWAQRIEDDMEPALAQVEEHLGNAFDSVAEQLDFAADRVDEAPMVENGEVEDTPLRRHPLHQLLGGFNHGPMNPFRIFGISSRKWWDGANVCVDRKVIEETEAVEEKSSDEASVEKGSSFAGMKVHMDMTMTTCQDGDNFHECTTKVSTNGNKKTVVIRYECCSGYRRKGKEFGCNEKVTDNLEETVKNLKANEFLELLQATDMTQILKENMTIFVPTDDAVEDFRHDLEKMNALDHGEGDLSYKVREDEDGGISYRKKRNSEITIVETPSMTDILKNHFLDGWVDTANMHDSEQIHTRNGAESANLKFTVYNTYPEKTVMANCAKIVSKNNYATNGVAHLVDKIILPATKTLAEIIKADSQFKRFSLALETSGLMDKLSQPDQQMTLFVPVDSAFDKLTDDTRLKIEAGNGCTQDILNAHILSNVVCSGVVESKAKAVNELKQYLNLERDEDNQLSVNGVKILLKDIVGSNGVLHVIEEIIVPKSARNLSEALEAKGATTMEELFSLSELDKTLDNFDNTTIFTPSESSLAALPKPYVDDLKADKKKLQDFLLYHVAKPKTCKCDFENNKLIDTGLKGKKLRINVYQSSPFGFLDTPSKVATVQCARLTSLDDEICGGLVHTTEKVLLPPEGDILEVLKSNNQFKTLRELLSFAGMEKELTADGSFTLLAPTDAAFAHLTETRREEIFGDKDTAAKVVKQHLIRDTVCCAGIPRSIPFFDVSGHRTASNEVVSLRKSTGGHIYANHAEVITCDMMADNGVIHAVDRLVEVKEIQQNVEQIVSESRRNPFNIFNLF